MERRPSVSKRNNLTDNFEQVYLAYKALQRYIPNSDESVLSNVGFIKVVNYKARQYWKKTQFFWISNGFDYEDVHSMIQLFGYSFFGSGTELTTDKDGFNVMLRFIDQRLMNVENCVTRKFQLDEVIRNNHQLREDDQEELAREFDEEGIDLNKDDTDNDEEFDNYYDEDVEVEDSGEILELYSANKAKKDSWYISTRLGDIAKEPERYSTQLAHYATTKHVGGDVRKAARKICEKYNIDYNQWAKEKVQDGFSQTEYDIKGSKWN
jgi:hypothetical protein